MRSEEAIVLKRALISYFAGLEVPKISESEVKYIVDEIVKLVAIVQKDPTLTQGQIWDKIHGEEDSS